MFQKWMDKDKRMTAREAVERFVSDGDELAIGNSLYSMPFALIHEIIRQGRKGMTVFQPAGIEDLDLLLLGKCVQRLVTAYNYRMVGNLMETVLERALRSGEVEIEDYSIYSLLTMLQAGAMGYPFLPVIPGIRETDIYKIERFHAGHKFGEVECPFSGEKVTVVEGRNPDVAVVHVQRADKFGNAQLWGALINTKWSCLASHKIIVSCEQIVDEEIILRTPHLTIVPGFRVCAVVEEPWGAHPCELLGFYDYDTLFRGIFFLQAASEEGGRAWLDEWVYGMEDRRAYLDHYRERFKTISLDRLEAKPYLSVPADYGSTERRAWDEEDIGFSFGLTRGEYLRALEERGLLFDG
jgi:glutaconate CoA-transferase, subunit A